VLDQPEAVELDLHEADEVREAMRRLEGKFAGRMSGVLADDEPDGDTPLPAARPLPNARRV